MNEAASVRAKRSPRTGRPRRKAAPATLPPSGPIIPISVKDAPREGFTAVGIVQRPHGTGGELRATPFAEGAPNLQRGRTVHLQGVARRVLRARPSRGVWILQLAGLSSRDEVDLLRGELLEAPDSQVAREEGAYFVHELIGIRVVTVDGRELGELVEVLQTGANDVYVVKGTAGEILIPAIPEVVTAIDLPVSVMRITLMPGLLDESK